MSEEPVCLKCGLPGDKCGCEPSGTFDPANIRKCQLCGGDIPDDVETCDDCTVDLMLYEHIKDRPPS